MRAETDHDSKYRAYAVYYALALKAQQLTPEEVAERVAARYPRLGPEIELAMRRRREREYPDLPR